MVFFERLLPWLVSVTPFGLLIISKRTLFPFIFGKAIFFQTLAVALAIVWLAMILVGRRTGRLPRDPMTLMIAIFFGTLTLSSILGVDFGISFWGRIERMDGLFSLAHFFLWYVAVAALLKKRDDWLIVLRLVSGVGIYLALHEFAQLRGLATIYGDFGARFPGTIGNPALLATVLVFVLFMALASFFYERRSPWRWLHAAAGVLAFVGILFTATRGALLGMIAGAAVFAFGFVWIRRDLVRSYGLKAAALLTLLTLYVAAPSNIVPKPFFVERLTSISLEENTARSRLYSWQSGLKAFTARPILGWGQVNYQPGFYRHFDPRQLLYDEQWFDKAHNKFVDVLVENGAIGLVAWLGIFIVASLLLWRARRDQDDAGAAIALIALFAAYLVQSAILFDTPGSWAMLFLALALVRFMTSTHEESRDAPDVRPTWQTTGAIILILVLIVGWFWGTVRPYQDNRNMKKALDNLSLGRPPKSEVELERAFRYSTFVESEGLRLYGQQFMNVLAARPNAPGVPEVRRWLINAFDQDLQQHPTNILNRFILSRTILLGSTTAQELETNDRNLERLKMNAATHPETYYDVALEGFARKDYDNAFKAYDRAIEILPEYRRTYFMRAALYATVAKHREAIADIEKFEFLGGRDRRAWQFMVQSYEALGDTLQVEKYRALLQATTTN